VAGKKMLNPHFQHLTRAYIFPIIESRLEQVKAQNSSIEIVNLGIGDIALPLSPHVVAAICQATQEMGTQEGLRGYAPSAGYPFLRERIAQAEYGHLGIEADEIFISDGTNSDTADIQEIFGSHCRVGIPDPTYPVYLDANILAGRHAQIEQLPCLEENLFSPSLPKTHCDLIYLCSPNNPTGMAMTRSELKKWVDYALQNNAILLVDNAYAAFVTSPDVPRSIFEIPGAKEVAIECRSFSKSAGFTGLRCAYTVLPKTVRMGQTFLHSYWNKRQNIKSNGVAYPIQRGAEAALSKEGRAQTQQQVESYLTQALRLQEGLSKMGHTCYGGIDSPYIWWKAPSSLTSWDFFDLLLQKCHLITIPGSGFGERGEGFVRLSAFTTQDKTAMALERIQRW
jgi:LL-diaminopimelate aminotransferase